jgi:hypothetical protein
MMGGRRRRRRLGGGRRGCEVTHVKLVGKSRASATNEKLTIFSSICRLYEETMEDDGCRVAEGSGLSKASAC